MNILCKIFWHKDDIKIISTYKIGNVETNNYSFECKRCWRIEYHWATTFSLPPIFIK
jgi:hypothetical protein